MPKILIKDREFQVSDAVSIAVLAERTEFGREVKALKDNITAKDSELTTAKDELEIAVNKLKTAKNALLLKDTLAKINEVDEAFETDETDPYKVMATVAGIEDGKDDVYVQAYFDSYVVAKVEALNKNILDKEKKPENKKTIIPDEYLGGK